jgi:hypothetical protein
VPQVYFTLQIGCSLYIIFGYCNYSYAGSILHFASWMFIVYHIWLLPSLIMSILHFACWMFVVHRIWSLPSLILSILHFTCWMFLVYHIWLLPSLIHLGSYFFKSQLSLGHICLKVISLKSQLSLGLYLLICKNSI